jgi:hypothetical protein
MKRIAGFLVLGASFLILVLYTIMFWLAYRANGWQILGLLAYLSGMLATAAFLGLFVQLALRLRTKKASPSSMKALPSSISPKVLVALISALQGDPNARVRSKVAMGLAELDLEESSQHHEHNELDNILISALKDRDPLVRSKAAVGLAELEFEESSQHHEHSKLEEVLFEEGP